MNGTELRGWPAIAVVALAAVIGSGPIAAQSAPDLAGRWDAIVISNGVEVPFPFEIAGAGPALRGWFSNGERRIESTAAHPSADGVVFRFGQYGSRLELRVLGRIARIRCPTGRGRARASRTTWRSSATGSRG